MATGDLTQMPSRKPGGDLGKYVIVRPRSDGTYRVLFEVPARLRPFGWLATTPLPINPPRTGDLNDPDERFRIKRDAATLYAKFLSAKGSVEGGRPLERSIATLIGTWEGSASYRDLKKVTQAGYKALAKDVQRWADLCAIQPDPTYITRADAEQFLAQFEDTPWTMWHLRKVFRLIMDQAIAKGWRTDNPLNGLRLKTPRSQVVIWEARDVEHYVEAAWAVHQPGVAALILTLWEIGQRLTDAVLFMRAGRPEAPGYHAGEAMFRFRQSKTGEQVAIPISDRLNQVLEAGKVEGSLYLFHEKSTGRPFRDVNRLSHVFEIVRAKAMANGARHLVLRALRHSCVVQLARAGCEIPEIASITGHSLSSATEILTHYLPRDSEVARNAQRKRGLIE